MGFVVSVFNASGKQLLNAAFTTRKALKDFIEWRIEDLLEQGAECVVVADDMTHTQTRYRANAIADCVFVGADWRYALVQQEAA